jgi:predicted SpoU family rRNA methylase
MGLDVSATLDALLIQAKKTRASYRYSEDEKMMNTLIVIGPDDERAVFPVGWRDEREKRIKMDSFAHAARQLQAQAIVLISDTRWTMSDIFALHFGLTSIEESNVEEFRKRYSTILNTMFDGQIKNLPREMWNEAVMVAIKGPGIEPQTRMASYNKGPNDDVVFTGDNPHSEMGRMQINIIPDWWD